MGTRSDHEMAIYHISRRLVSTRQDPVQNISREGIYQTRWRMLSEEDLESSGIRHKICDLDAVFIPPLFHLAGQFDAVSDNNQRFNAGSYEVNDE